MPSTAKLSSLFMKVAQGDLSYTMTSLDLGGVGIKTNRASLP